MPGEVPSGNRSADAMPASEIRFHDITFAYPEGKSISPITTSRRLQVGETVWRSTRSCPLA